MRDPISDRIDDLENQNTDLHDKIEELEDAIRGLDAITGKISQFILIWLSGLTLYVIYKFW